MRIPNLAIILIIATFSLPARSVVPPEPTETTSSSTTSTISSIPITTSTPSTTSTASTTSPVTTTPWTTSTASTTSPVTTTPWTTSTASTTSPATTTPWTTSTAPTSSPTPTTSTVPPTSTRRPHKPERGRWVVTPAGENYACIFLEMAASVDFYFINHSNEIEKGELNIPPNAISIGDCGETGSHKQVIKLSWYSLNYVNVLEFTFRKNDHIYEINKIVATITLDPRDFPSAKDPNQVLILYNKNNHFLTPEKMSYKCDKEHILPLHLAKNHVDIGHLKIRNIYLQAFSKITDQNSVKGIDCKSHHQTPNALLILCGGAIIGAITGILFTYILSKRRHRPHGYLSIIGLPQNDSENIKNSGFISNAQMQRSGESSIPYSSVKLLMKKFSKN